jgi:hypothetical protein
MKLLLTITSATVIAVLAHSLVLQGFANEEVNTMHHHVFGGKREVTGREDFKAKRVVFEHSFGLNAPPADIFPLLCPVREYDWIEHWECAMVYSDSGVAEDNCIFLTHMWSDNEVWVVSRYEPENFAIEFVVTRFPNMVMKLDIRIEDGGAGRSKLHWRRTFTGLSEDGNAFIAEFSEEKQLEQLKVIEASLAHYLSSGEMLRGHGDFHDKLHGR